MFEFLLDMFQLKLIELKVQSLLLTAITCPAKLPDMSCLDLWFWGLAKEEVRKSRLSTLTELKAVVEASAESVDPEEVKR